MAYGRQTFIQIEAEMDKILSAEARKQINEGIHGKYRKVAAKPEGSFRYPTGRAGLEAQKYDPQILNALPEEVLTSYCGVGNPFSLEPVNRGESVLDIGCGVGVDTLVAAAKTGPGGRAVGIDLVPEMLQRARENLRKTSIDNASFQRASAEELPFADQSFDVVISNGVFNLVPDKLKALKEAWRVLKPNGRLMMADQILTTQPPSDLKSMLESWAK